MEDERNIFEGMSERERADAVPLLINLGALIDVAEGDGDVLGVLDPESARMAEELGATEEGRSTISFLKVILGVDRPSEGPSM